jgi:hypothetical protein
MVLGQGASELARLAGGSKPREFAAQRLDLRGAMFAQWVVARLDALDAA